MIDAASFAAILVVFSWWFFMAREVALNVPHRLGAEEARRRVTRQLDSLSAQFSDKIGSSNITWTGNDAHIRVSALMQTATAEVLVGEDNVKIHIHLPLMLSPMSGKISGFLAQVADAELRR